MYSNSVIRRRSKFFHTQIQFSLSGDLFERKTDIQNRKTKKKFNTKLGTRFDVRCRESTPHLLEMTAIVRMIRVSHTNDHITSLNSGWPLKKKRYSQERSVSVITTQRDQPRARTVHITPQCIEQKCASELVPRLA